MPWVLYIRRYVHPIQLLLKAESPSSDGLASPNPSRWTLVFLHRATPYLQIVDRGRGSTRRDSARLATRTSLRLLFWISLCIVIPRFSASQHRSRLVAYSPKAQSESTRRPLEAWKARVSDKILANSISLEPHNGAVPEYARDRGYHTTPSANERRRSYSATLVVTNTHLFPSWVLIR